jgi:hypothetical protein
MDVVAYACTSVHDHHRPGKGRRRHQAVTPGRRAGIVRATAVTDPFTAVKAACTHLGIRRLGFVTPYIPSVSAAIREALEAEGIEIVAFGSFEQSEEHLIARISPDSVREALLRVGRSAACDGYSLPAPTCARSVSCRTPKTHSESPCFKDQASQQLKHHQMRPISMASCSRPQFLGDFAISHGPLS